VNRGFQMCLKKLVDSDFYQVSIGGIIVSNCEVPPTMVCEATVCVGEEYCLTFIDGTLGPYNMFWYDGYSDFNYDFYGINYCLTQNTIGDYFYYPFGGSNYPTLVPIEIGNVPGILIHVIDGSQMTGNCNINGPICEGELVNVSVNPGVLTSVLIDGVAVTNLPNGVSSFNVGPFTIGTHTIEYIGEICGVEHTFTCQVEVIDFSDLEITQTCSNIEINYTTCLNYDFYTIDFGDGNSISGSSPLINPINYQYLLPGTYNVNITLFQNNINILLEAEIVIVDYEASGSLIGPATFCCDNATYNFLSPDLNGNALTWFVTPNIPSVPSSGFIGSNLVIDWTGAQGTDDIYTITVYGMDANGCFISNSIEVKDCCLYVPFIDELEQPDTLETRGSSDPFINTSFCSSTLVSQLLDTEGNPIGSSLSTIDYVYINEDLIINIPFTISNTNKIFVAPGKKIIVNPGITLTINGSSIFPKCNEMWQGIDLIHQSSILIMNGSYVYGAIEGVSSKNGALFTINFSRFHDNYKGLAIHDYPGTHLGTVNNSVFSSFNYQNLIPPHSNLTKPYIGIWIQNVGNVNIGTTNLTANRFEFISYGIESYSSNVIIRGNTFREIFEPNPTLLNNIGIHLIGKNPHTLATIGGSNNSFTNTFINCDNGIRSTNAYNVDIKRNDFKDINLRGIHVGRNSNGSIIIEQNKIGSQSDQCYGIYTFQNIGTIHSINGNSINPNSQPNPNMAVGIFADRFTFSASPLHLVDINNNVINQCNIGIKLRNWPQAVIQDNTIKLNRSDSYITSYGSIFEGISADNCRGVQINDNNVIRQGGSASATINQSLQRGIAIENSFNAQVYKNNLSKQGAGIYARGQNGNAQFYCNTFTQNWNGFFFNAATIGDQGSPASGTNPTGISAENKWTNNLGPDGTDGSLNGTSASNPLKYYHRPPMATKGSDPSNSIDINNFWNDIMLGGNAESKCATGGGGGPFPGGPGIIRKEKLEKFANGSMAYANLHPEMTKLGEYGTYMTLDNDTSLLTLGLPDDGIYRGFYNSCGNTSTEKITKSQKLIDENNIVFATSENNAINTSTIQDQYIKEVQTIFLETYGLEIYNFNNQQQSDLEFIACLDAIENGPAVYQARALLGILGVCDNNGVVRSATIMNEETINSVLSHSLYPNPNDGTFTLETINSENLVFKVYDLNGKLIFEERLLSENSVYHFTLNVNSGLYIYQLSDSSGKIETGKISIK
jgi:hypothetical protein